MKLKLWSIGKPNESHLKEGTEMFTKRITNYFPVEWHIIPMVKGAASLSDAELKVREGELLLSLLKKDDFLVLLDERGKHLSSEQFAMFLQQRANEAHKNVIFLIGGAFGVSQTVFERANYIWSLSNLVFPHQLVRLILAEQIYRACSIMRNEKYHHV